MASKDDRVKLEIDGPGITPQTVDAVAAIEIARAYFHLLIKFAAEHDEKLVFKGLGVEDKCVALTSSPSNPSVAEYGAFEVQRMLEKGLRPSKKLEGSYNALREALLLLPKDQRANALVSGKKLRLTAQPVEEFHSHVSATKLRVRVVGIEGINRFRARFVSESEDRAFYLDVSESQAMDLAKSFQQEVEATVRLRRDSLGSIAGGELIEAKTIGPRGQAVEAWREWLAENAGDWEDVDDIEQALGEEAAEHGDDRP
jgi:hypothetical protein